MCGCGCVWVGVCGWVGVLRISVLVARARACVHAFVVCTDLLCVFVCVCVCVCVCVYVSARAHARKCSGNLLQRFHRNHQRVHVANGRGISEERPRLTQQAQGLCGRTYSRERLGDLCLLRHARISAVAVVGVSLGV